MAPQVISYFLALRAFLRLIPSQKINKRTEKQRNRHPPQKKIKNKKMKIKNRTEKTDTKPDIGPDTTHNPTLHLQGRTFRRILFLGN
jgi:hypothetical protein